MVTYAQRKAVDNYNRKLRNKGFRCRSLMATDNQWKIIKPLYKFIKQIAIENLTNVCIDDETGTITFSVKEGAKLIDTEQNEGKDDVAYRTEQETSVRA